MLFIWTALSYRTEWRYRVEAHKVIAIKAGDCSIGAIDRQPMDKALGLYGEEEFTLYLAPVGKLP